MNIQRGNNLSFLLSERSEFMADFKIKLGVDIDTKDIQSKLDNLKIDNIKVTDNIVKDIQGILNSTNITLNNVTLGKGVVGSLQKQLSNLKVKLDGVDFVGGASDSIQKQVSAIGKSGQQAVQQLNKNISQGINSKYSNILETFKSSLSNAGMDSKEIDNIANRINQLGVHIETINQSVSKATNKKSKKNILSVDISGIDELGQAVTLTEQYDKATGNLIKSINTVSTVQQKAGKSSKTLDTQRKQAANNLTNQIEQLQRAATDKNAKYPIIDTEHLSELNKKYTDIVSSINKVKNASNDNFISEQNNAKTLISDYKSLVSEYRNAEKVSESEKKQINQIQDMFSKDTFGARYSTMESKFKAYKGQSSSNLTAAKKQLDEYDKQMQSLKRHFDVGDSFSLNDKQVISAFNDMTTAAEKYNNAMTKVRNESSKTLDAGVAERSANEVVKYSNANTKALKKYKAEIVSLEQQYRNMTTVAEKNSLDIQFKKLKSNIEAEGLTGKTLIGELKRGWKQIAQFAGTYGIQQKLIEYAGQTIKNVADIDTAMTSLKKVTNETDETYNTFLSNAGKKAQTLGSNISNLVTQTSEWAKLGYNLESASSLAETSMIYSNVGEVDDKTAVSDLVTVLKAYDMDSSQAMDIVDKLNELGKVNIAHVA